MPKVISHNAQFQLIKTWFKTMGWRAFQFQMASWQAYLEGKSGIINAPTGSGKTYAALLGPLLAHSKEMRSKAGPVIIWITPIRALAKEIEIASNRAIAGLGVNWSVGIRHGDTTSTVKQKQSKNWPQLLITTPETLQLLLTRKNLPDIFGNLQALVVDEWHEMLGSKRAVQVELAISKLRSITHELRIWGISATIGNMEEAKVVLLGNAHTTGIVIKSKIEKKIIIETLLPEDIEKFPWGGHLGIKLLPKVQEVISNSKTTLIFTNTRAQAEIWYQRLLENAPSLAGLIAMHHGSISKELRQWVEESLHNEQLKAVVCTSSLDLGVDFRPVESIVQIGGPKGVSRFMQRAGRSGHSPGKTSKIYFVPTNSLEILEATALRDAITEKKMENRMPYLRSFDVLIQYLLSLAVGDGFYPQKTYEEVKSTFSYASISESEWAWILGFLKNGGSSLHAYDEFQKLEEDAGRYFVKNKRIAYRHRLSIGTIVSDASLEVKFVSGARLGTIEEWFISRLKPGDVFWFAGRTLEYVRVHEMTVQVKSSKQKTALIPSWMGGRMPLSSQLGEMLRMKLRVFESEDKNDLNNELRCLQPLIALQKALSLVPNNNQFLIEYYTSKEGYHLFFYPFEGRFVHEGMAALIAHRMAKLKPISFSIAMNDYGFELLSDQPIPIEEALEENIFTTEQLRKSIGMAINATEMARRKFRDIATISGLVFQGFPGNKRKEKHLQSSSQLFFDVFKQYEPNNLLLLQAYEEVMSYQIEESRLRNALDRINQQEIMLQYIDQPSPFCFPIMVERLREKLSSEKLEERVKKMQLALVK